MRDYLLKRVLLIVPTLFLVTLLVFLLMHMRSGDVVIQMLEGYAYADTVEALRRELGLDKPLHEQYLAWMSGVLQGDLGRSLWTKEPILVEFARRFPVTLELTLLTIIISVTFGLGVGVLSAVRQETWVDYLGRVVAILALAHTAVLAYMVGRHTVLRFLKVSAGQSTLWPEHVSATSQAPATGRQTVPAASKPLAGQ